MTRGSSIAENYVNPPAEASKIKKIEPYKLALMGFHPGLFSFPPSGRNGAECLAISAFRIAGVNLGFF
jgi:hypothetical protein